MLMVKEVPDGKIGLDLRCVDRMLLNGWVRYLQMPGGAVNFIREQQGWPISSPAGLGKPSDAFPRPWKSLPWSKDCRSSPSRRERARKRWLTLRWPA